MKCLRVIFLIQNNSLKKEIGYTVLSKLSNKPVNLFMLAFHLFGHLLDKPVCQH